MPTLKTGEKITWKELWNRWKSGMEKITPLQQCLIIQFGQITTIIGTLWGLIFSAMMKQYWLTTILVGALIVQGVGYLGNWQKKQILKRVESQLNFMEVNQNGESDFENAN